MLDKLSLLEAWVGRLSHTDLRGRFSGCCSVIGQLGCLAEVQWETGNQGWDGPDWGKVVEPVVTRHFPAGEAAPHCLCLGTGAWDSGECTSESLSRPSAGRAAGCLAGSLAPAPPGRSIACRSSMWQSPSTKAAAGRLVLEEPSVPRAGGCPALQPLSGPGPRHLTLPHWAGFLDGCQGRERSPRLEPC